MHARVARLVWFAFCAICLTFAVLTAAEAATVTFSKFPPNPGVQPGGGWKWSSSSNWAEPTGPRSWVNGTYGSLGNGIRASQGVSLLGKAGALPLTVMGTVTLGEAGAAIGRCVIGANPVCAAGTAAYLLYKGYRALPPDAVPGGQVCGANASSPNQGAACTFPSGQFDYDKGIPSETGTSTQYRCGQLSGTNVVGGYFYSTSSYADACSKLVAAQPTSVATNCLGAGTLGCTWTNYSLAGISTSFPYIRRTQQYGGQTPQTQDLGLSGGSTTTSVTSTSCPPSLDALNPAYSIPGGSPVGPDGRCPSARYNHEPKTVAQIAEIIRAAGQDWTVLGPQVRDGLKDAIDLGGQTVPAEITSTGPASQVGSPTTTTTTGPSGTTTKTTTNTYNYTYGGDTITYNVTTVTTTNINGTTTTDTTVSPGTTAPGEPGQTDCEKFPDSFGCLKLGDPPTDTVPKKDTAIPGYAAESVGLPSGCPADVTAGGVTVSYGPTCAGILLLKPLIIGLGAATAALMMVFALRSG